MVFRSTSEYTNVEKGVYLTAKIVTKIAVSYTGIKTIRSGFRKFDEFAKFYALKDTSASGISENLMKALERGDLF